MATSTINEDGSGIIVTDGPTFELKWEKPEGIPDGWVAAAAYIGGVFKGHMFRVKAAGARIGADRQGLDPTLFIVEPETNFIANG